MTHISTSGAYVRKRADVHALQAAGFRDAPIEQKLWALLETPQTIESLQRAAGHPQVDQGRIKHVMERLLDADLIELSPDS